MYGAVSHGWAIRSNDTTHMSVLCTVQCTLFHLFFSFRVNIRKLIGASLMQPIHFSKRKKNMEFFLFEIKWNEQCWFFHSTLQYIVCLCTGFTVCVVSFMLACAYLVQLPKIYLDRIEFGQHMRKMHIIKLALSQLLIKEYPFACNILNAEFICCTRLFIIFTLHCVQTVLKLCCFLSFAKRDENFFWNQTQMAIYKSFFSSFGWLFILIDFREINLQATPHYGIRWFWSWTSLFYTYTKKDAHRWKFARLIESSINFMRQACAKQIAILRKINRWALASAQQQQV